MFLIEHNKMQYIVNMFLSNELYICFLFGNGAYHLICNIVQFYGFNIVFKINIKC